jgi:uncharacterized protein with PIN domain
MHRAQIILKDEQHTALTEIARQESRSISEVVREMVNAGLQARQRQQIRRAVRDLQSDYRTDADLAAFTALDGEDFHA